MSLKKIFLFSSNFKSISTRHFSFDSENIFGSHDCYCFTSSDQRKTTFNASEKKYLSVFMCMSYAS